MKTYCLAVLLAVAGVVWGQPQGPDILWTRYYGDTTGTSSGRLRVTSLASYLCENGDILFTAMEQRLNPQFLGSSLRRLNPNGESLWYRLYELDFDECCETGNGDYMCVGYARVQSSTVPLIARLNNQGDTLWTRTYPFNNFSYAQNIQKTTDGNYVVGGIWRTDLSQTHPEGIYIICVNSQGDTVWTRGYLRGNATSELCQVENVRLLPISDGGFLVLQGGSCQSTPRPIGYYVMKINASGDSLWARHYQPPTSDEDQEAALVNACGTPDGGFILTGEWGDNTTDYGRLIRIDSDGDTVWTHNYEWLRPRGIICDVSDGYVFAAIDAPINFFEGYLVKIDEQGSIQWISEIGPATLSDNAGNMRVGNVYLSEDRGYFVTAMAQIMGNEYWDLAALSRIASAMSGDHPGNSIDIPTFFVLKEPSPNPFNATTTLSFSLLHTSPVSLIIFNLLGQAVYQADLGMLNAGEHRHLFDASELPSGVYLARVQAGERSQMRKMVLLK